MLTNGAGKRFSISMSHCPYVLRKYRKKKERYFYEYCKTRKQKEYALTENAPVIYTPDEIMAIMRISRSSVYKLFAAEDFPCIKVGGMLRIERTAFEEWLKAKERKSGNNSENEYYTGGNER